MSKQNKNRRKLAVARINSDKRILHRQEAARKLAEDKAMLARQEANLTRS